MKIQNKINHTKALDRLNELMDKEHELGSPHSDEMIRLADAIAAYEEIHFPISDLPETD